MRYWVCVTSPDNWKICRSELKWGVEEEYLQTMKRLKKGEDMLIFYVSGDQEFKGVFNVAERGYYYDATPNWKDKRGRLFPHRIKIEPIFEASVSIGACFNDLLFITNRKKGSGGWSDHFQFSMISIRQEDYETIRKHMERRARDQTRLV